MPTYDYVCDGCGHAFELFQSMTDEVKKTCPKCKKKKLRRLIGTGASRTKRGPRPIRAAASRTPARSRTPAARRPRPRAGIDQMPRCPVCDAAVSLETTPTVPFCSDRCRLIDLGRWLDESYALPEPPRSDEDEGDGEAPPRDDED